jgi:hypothetical protein
VLISCGIFLPQPALWTLFPQRNLLIFCQRDLTPKWDKH